MDRPVFKLHLDPVATARGSDTFLCNLQNLRIDLMKRDPRTILRTLWRCLKLQCPVCGRASIVERPFNLKHHCTSCGVIFKREEGFFVGAIMANVVATEVFILLVYLACLAFTNLGDQIG